MRGMRKRIFWEKEKKKKKKKARDPIVKPKMG
jgi:hypothetical protein